MSSILSKMTDKVARMKYARAVNTGNNSGGFSGFASHIAKMARDTPSTGFSLSNLFKGITDRAAATPQAKAGGFGGIANAISSKKGGISEMLKSAQKQTAPRKTAKGSSLLRGSKGIAGVLGNKLGLKG